ncbi:MAG: M48 family metalloprotease [Verrucomicrobiota bacterium]
MEESQHILDPLPYHVELRDYLKSRERALWNWFASARAQADFTENLRMDLLKSTYRLDAESHPELYQGVKEAKERLQLDIPVTVYQAQNSPQANAALYFISGEGHVVFSGPVLSLLSAEEIKSVLGHELAHYHLWQWEEGDLQITDRLMQAMAGDPRAALSHEQTARRFQLYTEIFADRGSLCVTGDLHPVVAGLVKIQTGLAQVSAPAYLKQAEEIFAKDNVATESLSHPEAFIRARALSLWQDQRQDSQPHIARMIEGAEALDELDLIGQARLTWKTRRLLEHFLQPKWFQTPAVLGHAKMFFDDFQPAATRGAVQIQEFQTTNAKLREYYCYLLLDFVTADPELDDMPLVAALDLSRQLNLAGQFERLAAKELKLRVRDVRKLKEQAAEMLTKAEVAG